MTQTRSPSTADASGEARVDSPRSSKPLYPHPVIAREGWPFIVASTGLALVAWWFVGFAWSLPLWLVTVFILQFFRDPKREPPQGTNLVIAPADGRIVSVERMEDPYLKRDAIRLSVFMNVFNVHSNRSPVDGVVNDAWYSQGKFFNAALAKASASNERNALWIRTENGIDVTCVQIAGLIARRILCYVKAGERLRRGERFGFIRFGSRVDVYLPPASIPRARVGDKVYAGRSVLAELT